MRNARWSSIRILLGGIAFLCVLIIGCGGDESDTSQPTAAETPAATAIPTAVSGTPVVATRAPDSAAAAVDRDDGYLKAPEEDPRYGGVLRWGGIANSTLYDLHQTGSIANMGPQAPMFDLLVQVDPVSWDSIIPDLATSWNTSDDGLTYTFTLREGVKFHDGAPLTADDVAASFSQIVFPPAGVLSPRQGLFDAVTEIVSIDAGTVEFRLSEPRPFLLSAIKGGFNVIVRKETLEANNLRSAEGANLPRHRTFRHGESGTRRCTEAGEKRRVLESRAAVLGWNRGLSLRFGSQNRGRLSGQ